MTWDDAASQVHLDTLEEFGADVVYQAAGGSSYPLASGGVYSEEFEEVSPDTGATITTTQPNVVVRADEWPADWDRKDDRLLIGGKTYRPREVRKFGNPHALRILLHEVT